MKSSINLILAAALALVPALAKSQASINSNVSVQEYPAPNSWQVYTSFDYSGTMNDFTPSHYYRITPEFEAPYLVSNFDMGISGPSGAVSIYPGVTFQYNNETYFNFNYDLTRSSIGQTQELRFKIEKRIGTPIGIWNWQTTFFYYLSPQCSQDGSFGSGQVLTAPLYEFGGGLTVPSTITPPGSPVVLDGGQFVLLTPGFNTNLAGGGYVLVVNDGCWGAYQRHANGSSSGSVQSLAGSNSDGEQKIAVFPNPNSGQFQINSSELITKISVKNLNGEIVFEQENVLSNSPIIKLNNMSKGIYIAELTFDGSKRTQREKIIIE